GRCALLSREVGVSREASLSPSVEQRFHSLREQPWHSGHDSRLLQRDMHARLLRMYAIRRLRLRTAAWSAVEAAVNNVAAGPFTVRVERGRRVLGCLSVWSAAGGRRKTVWFRHPRPGASRPR